MITFGLGIKVNVVSQYYMEDENPPISSGHWIFRQRRGLSSLQLSIDNRKRKILLYILLLTLASEEI